jgi:hypothetical protein
MNSYSKACISLKIYSVLIPVISVIYLPSIAEIGLILEKGKIRERNKVKNIVISKVI